MTAAVPPENPIDPDNRAAIARIILAVRRRREAEQAKAGALRVTTAPPGSAEAARVYAANRQARRRRAS